MFSPHSCVSNPFPLSWLTCYLYFILTPFYCFANPGNQKCDQFSGLFGQGVLSDINFLAQGTKWKYKL